MDEVILYIDGAALPNPGHGGAGVVLMTHIQGRTYKRVFGAYMGENVTNNAAEIFAAIAGLTTLKRSCVVTILTDSQYLVGTMTKNWVRRANNELWDMLDMAVGRHEVTWQWVKGHAGDPHNELAHEFAERAASERQDIAE